MSEPAAGGEKDGEVYLGSSGIQMKVGVKVTPPAGTAPLSRATPTPAPRATPAPWLRETPLPAPRAAQTPGPRLTPAPRAPLSPWAEQTPVPRIRPTPQLQPPSRALNFSDSKSTVPPVEVDLVRGVNLTRSAIFGLCLLMFSSGIIVTVVIDRYWPTRKADFGGLVPAPAGTAATQPESALPNIETVPAPSGEPTPVNQAAAPAGAETKPAPAVEPPAPAAPAPAPKIAAPPPAQGRAAAPRVPPAQGRVSARKRPGAATSGSASENDRTMAPTGSWIDPFE